MIRQATWKGAGMMGHTPERNWNRTQGGNTRQRPKDQDEDLIQDLKQKEKSLNAVFISVREPFHHLSLRALRVDDDTLFFAQRLARSPPALCIASCTTFEIYRAYLNRFYTLQYTRTFPKGLPPQWLRLRRRPLSRRPRRARLIFLIPHLHSTSVRPALCG